MGNSSPPSWRPSSTTFGGERDAGEAADVNLVGRNSCGGVDGLVVGRRQVRQQHVPVGSFVVADHEEHLGQNMVDPLDADVGAGVVSAGVDVADANAVVDYDRLLGSELLPIVGEESRRAPPERGMYSLSKCRRCRQ